MAASLKNSPRNLELIGPRVRGPHCCNQDSWAVLCILFEILFEQNLSQWPLNHSPCEVRILAFHKRTLPHLLSTGLFISAVLKLLTWRIITYFSWIISQDRLTARFYNFWIKGKSSFHRTDWKTERSTVDKLESSNYSLSWVSWKPFEIFKSVGKKGER